MVVCGFVRRTCLALICAILGTATTRAAEPERWRVPEGFAASLYADDALVPDATAMTVDPLGRVVVAGPGYIKILIDIDNDGRADTAKTFESGSFPGADALAYVENELGTLALAAIRAGRLILIHDRNHDDRADADNAVNELLDIGGFHYLPNSLRTGPDGALYIACAAGEEPIHFGKYLSFRSPMRFTPTAGVMLRVAWQGDRGAGGQVLEMFTGGERVVDVLAHGFCDPHGVDFHPAGNLLTVDVDNKTEVGLPWYAPLRLFDVAQGREHGWLKAGEHKGWNRPGYFIDSIAPAAELGSGVPSELVTYRHRQFPERYRGGVFLGRWDYGRVDYIPLEPVGSTLRGKSEKFFETLGDSGLAPIDLAVGPAGDLFVACGGRSTRGSVIRIRHTAGHAGLTPQELTLKPAESEPPSLDRILNVDQPTAAWSRHVWLHEAKRLGSGPLFAAIVNPKRTVAEQVRAVEVISELYFDVPEATMRQALDLKRPELSARLAWLMSRRGSSVWRRILGELTFDPDPRVQLAAWDAYRQSTQMAFLDAVKSPSRLPNWPAADDPQVDPRVRAVLVATALNTTPDPNPNPDDPDWATKNFALQRLRYVSTEGDWLSRFQAASTKEEKLRCIRSLQLVLSDFPSDKSISDEPFAGYRLAGADPEINLLVKQRLMKLLDAVPTGDHDLDREIFRTLAGFHVWQAFFEKLIDRWTDDSDPIDDLHYLICAAVPPRKVAPVQVVNGDARLAADAKRWRRSVAAALVGLEAKFAKRGIRVEQEWNVVVERLLVELLKRDPELPAAIVAHPGFGRAGHAIFVAHLTPAAKRAAAEKILATVAGDEETRWTPTLIDVVSSTNDKRAIEVLRKLWKDPSLQPSLFPILLADDRPEDLPKFVECLMSPRPELVQRAALRLQRREVQHTPAELTAAVRGLRQMCSIPEARAARDSLTTLIGIHAERLFSITEPSPAEIARRSNALRDAYQPVFSWYTIERHQAASAERSPDGVDPKAWRKRLLTLDWEDGVAARGEQLFVKKQCHRCHNPGGSKLGPDLAGATERYSPTDLMATVVEPSRFVPPTYRPTTFELKNGRTYTGIPVYDSSGVVLLQTGAATTVRLFGNDISARVESTKSIMPLGLLSDLQPSDFADLYAYLKSLGYGTRTVEDPPKEEAR
jgi:putative heme-binding domain-containing protein